MLEGILTISKSDFYDFIRCPKIVALKAHRKSVTPPKPRISVNRRSQYEIGSIGEMATKAVFSDDDIGAFADNAGEFAIDDVDEEYDEEEILEDESYIPRAIEINLAKKGVVLDAEMKKILKETVDGLKNIKQYLTDEYGRIRILGHAESRNGILPGRIRPDFVAVSEKNKPVLIEVKNSVRPNSRPDVFQASFYNSIAQRNGLVLLEERVEDGKTSVLPRQIPDVSPETILVYPRLGTYEKITDTIRIDQRVSDSIWQAKMLGILGKMPHTDCGTFCPHHRYGVLPEDNIEPPVPLPLAYAEGLRENGRDLDIDYLSKFLAKTGLGRELRSSMSDFRYSEFRLRMVAESKPSLDIEKEKKDLERKREEYLSMFSAKTGISRNIIDRLSEVRHSIWKDERKIIKDMQDEISPWKKALGKDRFKKMNTSVKRYASSLYGLPENSYGYIKKSWKSWN